MTKDLPSQHTVIMQPGVINHIPSQYLLKETCLELDENVNVGKREKEKEQWPSILICRLTCDSLVDKEKINEDFRHQKFCWLWTPSKKRRPASLPFIQLLD